MAKFGNAYLQIISKKGYSCKYKRLDQSYKIKYQNGYAIYAALDSRSDNGTPAVIAIMALLERRAIVILTCGGWKRRMHQVANLDKEISDSIDALPGV